MQQNYPENIIVTVRLKLLNLEADVRLPSDSPFETWQPELIGVLNQYRGTYLNPVAVSVCYNGRELRAEDTLASLGIWDGSILCLEER